MEPAPDDRSLEERLNALGKQIRDARYEKGWSQEELSDKSGVSGGLLSQIERGIGNPSYSTLVKLGRALGVPFTRFFDHGVAAENNAVVRRDKRRKLILPNKDIVFESLSPDSNRRVEVFWWQVVPGFSSSDVPSVMSVEETLIVVTGRLDFKLGDRRYQLEEGDSIYIEPGMPYWYGNSSDEVATCISAVSPPPF